MKHKQWPGLGDIAKWNCHKGYKETTWYSVAWSRERDIEECERKNQDVDPVLSARSRLPGAKVSKVQVATAVGDQHSVKQANWRKIHVSVHRQRSRYAALIFTHISVRVVNFVLWVMQMKLQFSFSAACATGQIWLMCDPAHVSPGSVDLHGVWNCASMGPQTG